MTIVPNPISELVAGTLTVLTTQYFVCPSLGQNDPLTIYMSEQTLYWVAIGPATRCDKTGHLPAILGFWKHRRPSQVSPRKSQQCGQSATQDGMFLYSPLLRW